MKKISKKNKKNTKNFFIFSILFIVVFFVSYLFLDKDYKIHKNPVDFFVSLNRDRYVNESIASVDQRFGHIVFDQSQKQKRVNVINQIANSFGAFKLFYLNSLYEDNKNFDSNEIGSWLWTPIMLMTTDYMKSIISGAKSRDINAIYLSLDSYLDIFIMPEGPKKEEMKKRFSEKILNFIKIANENGIEVDAEAGWKNWAEEGNEYKAFAVVDFVKSFNSENNYRFRGFQYDVEPYLLDSFKDDPFPILKNFLSLIDKTESFLSDTDLRFSVVIPDFYDKKDGVISKFDYGGSEDYVLEHLINILDQRFDNSIIVMSYRNFAEGEDGSIEVSKNEMETLKKNSTNTKIIIAQETGDFPPPFITFHNTSKEYFDNEVSKLRLAFDNNPNFGGIAIHYINSFLALK